MDQLQAGAETSALFRRVQTDSAVHTASQLVLGALSPEINLPGREANHSPIFISEFKNAWIYTSISPIPLYGMVLD
jgi:hypothetical protein